MSDLLTPEADKLGEKKALVFDIQRFCLHDGPGIRTTLFFKGCSLRCAWCHNPESHRARQEVAFFAHCCVQCYACREVCPKTAILTGPERRIDDSLCDGCGMCADSCLTQALRMIGKSWGTADLLREARKDRDFFISSGGGVTLSGGEPMLQADFLEGFLPHLKAEDIHVNLETCGHFPWADMERIALFLDLIYFDLKQMDTARHESCTTRGNGLILHNFRRLAASFPHLQPRMPVIPGINDDEKNIFATAALLHECAIDTIHCLPYHRLGEAKLGRIGTTRHTPDLNIADRPDLKPVVERFAREGIHVIAYD
ncbi:MAG: glycyl-radical enzyme activating protein [Smithellaceae bacterium]|nr:glycyl-radical enzyme activating protein [Smithellaceae bacterium]